MGAGQYIGAKTRWLFKQLNQEVNEIHHVEFYVYKRALTIESDLGSPAYI